MDLTPLQRKAAFVVIVAALAGLGAFLLTPGSSQAHSQARRGHHPASSPAQVPATSPAATTSPVPVPAGVSPSPAAVNIYRWLPFSQQGLAIAAAVVRAFSADYATYTYTQTAAAYVAPMKNLVTSQLSGTLARGFAAPGVAQQRTSQKESATGSGQITGLRAFGPASLTFLVTVTQRTTSSRGSSRGSTNYAVTVTGTGTRWQVSDIELATAGNA